MGYAGRPFVEEVVPHLKPGLMKGPNAQLPFVDEMDGKINLETWNNIPLPLVDAIRVFQEAFKEVKQLYF